VQKPELSHDEEQEEDRAVRSEEVLFFVPEAHVAQGGQIGQ
jgi:hypothetical protein